MKIQVQNSQPLTPAGRSSQKIRFYAQLFSIAVNIVIGVQFYLFVKYIESGGRIWDIPRPPGVEAWLPIGSLVSLKHFFHTGIINNIHPSGLIIFVTIMLTAFFFKKGFCSWVCPVGFFSEMLGNISDKVFGKRIIPPWWLDYFLRSLKYIILVFFVWAVVLVSTAEQTASFLFSDYNIVSDMLMMRFFTEISLFSLVVLSILFVLSLIIRGFWCRYLCPYGALLGLIGLISPTKIKRNADSCIDCSSCATACPSFIKVDKVKEVVSDECTACMACVDSCPVNKTLEISIAGKTSKTPSFKWAAILIIFFWGTLFTAKMIGPWDNAITDEQYMRTISAVSKGGYSHP